MANEKHPFPNFLDENEFDNLKINNWLLSNSAREKRSTECWDCDWSRDGSLFAWSCGQRIVKIIPVSQINYKIELCDHQDVVTIDSRQIVTALSFCSCTAALERFLRLNLEHSTGYRSFHWEKFKELLIVGLRNGRIRIYDTETGRVLLELIDHRDTVTKLSMAPNNSLLLVSSSTDGTIKCWDLTDDGNMMHTFTVGKYVQPGVKHQVKHVVWSSDSKRIAAAGTFKTIVIFDLEEKRCLQMLSGHLGIVTCCDFSPDGVLLASCSTDSNTIVWNSHTGDLLCKLGHQFPPPSYWLPSDSDTTVKSCKFSPDGLRVATAADDDYVRVWDLTSTDLPSAVCQIADPISLCFKGPGSTLLSVGTGSGSVAHVDTKGPPHMKLSDLCRVAVNRRLHHQPSALNQLLLPNHLKSYLVYNIREL